MIIMNSVKKQKNTARNETKKPNKLKSFYRKVKDSIKKSKPMIKFLKIYISFNSFFKLIIDIAMICSYPDVSMMYILYK